MVEQAALNNVQSLRDQNILPVSLVLATREPQNVHFESQSGIFSCGSGMKRRLNLRGGVS